MKLTLSSSIAKFGASAKSKLANVAASGEPEDQLRAPLEQLIADLALLCGLPEKTVAAVGESAVTHLKTRPDYAVTLRNALVGFIEVKAPGKGADPRRFKDPHDKEQWEKLQSLPNLVYTDGNEFSLWRSGEPVGAIVRLGGDIAISGSALDTPADLLVLFEDFFQWQPIAPRTAKDLAGITARLCRLLRDEVTEQLEARSPALTALATDWRKLLFPEATDEQFADGYAQAVTFGLLIARARDIPLASGLDQVAKKLAPTNSLIGAALRLLTDEAESQHTLTTSLGTLTRVLDVVSWHAISKGTDDAWLYFYEDFLAVYDNDLRKQTGSYYTPPQVVESMVRLVDEVLRGERFGISEGLASPEVTVADPAVGTGTFVLGVLRHIANAVADDQGEGAVPDAIDAAVKRLIAFEMQLGPFAVAQLRIHAELFHLIGRVPKTPVRMYVTDTLDNPHVEQEYMFHFLEPIAQSRRLANEIKKTERITVVIGNPPYKEKAKGRGGWIEPGNPHSGNPAPLSAWMPPAAWGVSAHSKHLRNLYVYFWRWATWKVFDQKPNAGVVCYITVAGFLNGPGFQKMRDYLRRTADAIWVIDCSPEGHRPEVNTRIFQGVMQPVCIVMVSRSPKADPKAPAVVRFRSLKQGHREQKFEELAKLTLKSKGWEKCSTEWRAPFLPEATGAWSTYPALEDLFVYDGSGVMPGRTWVIAPDAESLKDRWHKLIHARPDRKEALFVPHLNKGKLGDRHVNRVVVKSLPGYRQNLTPIAQERAVCSPPVRYGFRSFDRQWIIPDNRVINRPNPELWATHSGVQVYLTAVSQESPSSGPALTFTGLVPDLDHYNGRGGRALPLWGNDEATVPNILPALLEFLGKQYRQPVTPEDAMAYIAAIAAHPAFTERFRPDLAQPGLRIPITAEAKLFAAAVELGRTVIWLHTFGERYTDVKAGRPKQAPRLDKQRAPRIPKEGAIPSDSDHMPDEIEYDADKRRLLVGTGFIENVSPAMWNYEVSGKQVLVQWFSYRKKDRARPIIGDRRKPSELGNIQPDHWLAEYTAELLNVLHVLGWLIDLEPKQAELLERIGIGRTLTADELKAAGALGKPLAPIRKNRGNRAQSTPGLFEAI